MKEKQQMENSKKKKKWYDTWWGALWTLALVDANPGRGLRVFMEVDRDLQELDMVADEKPVLKPSRWDASKRVAPSPANATRCNIYSDKAA